MAITRIVRMDFHPDMLPQFEAIFEASKAKIRAFPGCLHLEMHQDPQAAHIRYTFSRWESEAALEEYRKSELFSTTWAATKVLFQNKPQAFSLQQLEVVS